jgi:hypothetical protein
MTDDTTPEATPDAKTPEEDAKRRQNMLRAGIGIGVGSAAVMAALLYANKDKIKKKLDRPAPEPTD